MKNQIRVKVSYLTFSIFLLFLVIAALGTGNSGATGFSVREREENNKWIIEFVAKESADLVIETEVGQGYSSIDDVEFIELRCDDSVIIPNILTNKIIYENYHCYGKTSIKFIVNSEGRFKQKLSFGDNSESFSFKNKK